MRLQGGERTDMDNDPRQAAVERAIRRYADLMLQSGATASDVEDALATAADQLEDADTDDRRNEMLSELGRLEQAGRARDAVKVVARKFARDPGNQRQVESLARKLRRWREKIADMSASQSSNPVETVS
jgi:hypothetical protein